MKREGRGRLSPLYDPGKSLVVTGGGTGGHVIPAIEIARAHQRLSSSPVLYVGTPGSLEERLAARANLPFAAVRAGGVVGKSLLGKLAGGASILQGVGGAIRMLRRFRPGLVVGTGGYVQVPVIVAAGLLRIPALLVEPNRVAGLANKVLAPFVSRVVYGWERGGGIPLAPDVRGPEPDANRFERMPLRLLIMGGSQGAQMLNERLPEVVALAVRRLEGRPVEIIHQCGERWLDATKNRYQQLGLAVRVEGFLPEISKLFREQSLVIARAGAMTVAEITASGTPAIYIPFPHSAGGHQQENAREVERTGGGWCWEESSLMEKENRGQELAGLLSAGTYLYERGQKAWEHSPGISASEWLTRQ